MEPEVKRLRHHSHATNATGEAALTQTAKEVLQFTDSWVFDLIHYQPEELKKKMKNLSLSVDSKTVLYEVYKYCQLAVYIHVYCNNIYKYSLILCFINCLITFLLLIYFLYN